MAEPTLTVFLPNYNHARFLPQALENLEKQSYQPLEIIIVDDASTDNSVEIMEEFARKHSHVRFIKNDINRGVAENANMALEMSKGTFFCGVAADDRTKADYFEKSIGLLAEHPDAGFCSSLSYMIDEKGNQLGIYPTPVVSDKSCYLTPQEVLKTLRLSGPWFMANTTIWRRAALVDVGLFQPELGPFYDGFMAQVLALRHGACYIPEPLCDFRIIAGQQSEATYNAQTAFPLYRYALNLMRTTYADLFPEDYIDDFEKRTLAYTMERSIARSNKIHFDYLKELAPNPRMIDKFLLLFVRAAMGFQFLLTKIWLVIAVRHEFWPALGRAIKKAVSACLPWQKNKP